MKMGIIGLPNVGKSTLFNAITNAGAECANFPFCTIKPNIGIVAVPDNRLNVLAKLFNSEKITPAVVEIMDIAGLIKGASKGEGLGNKFLANVREVDALIHVVRCFEDNNIIHVEGRINPVDDVAIINLELIFADLEHLKKQIIKNNSLIKTNNKIYIQKALFLERLEKHLEEFKPANTFIYNNDEKDFYYSLNLLTSKPTIYVANIKEEDMQNDINKIPYVEQLQQYAQTINAECIVVCAKFEEELAKLNNQEEKKQFLNIYNIEESGLDKLVKKSYNILGLMNYLTAGQKEVRAWTIIRGTNAQKAAGKIHSDFEKNFIKAEIVSYDKLIKFGSFQNARDNGEVRIEGKDYIVQDNDVIIFKINQSKH